MIGKQQPQNLMIKWMCNDQMKRLVKRMTIEQVLKNIARERGMSALRNGEALVGLFQDFSRNQLRPQANALKVFVSCQGNTRILNLQNAPLQEQQVQLHRLVQEMSIQHNMREETAVEVCSAFWRAVYQKDPPVMWEPVAPTPRETPDELFQRGCACLQQDKPGKEEEAVKWFRMAAELGHAKAQWYLGYRLMDGIGTPVNQVEGLNWFRRAAAGGQIEANNHIGYSYYYGQGVEQDHAQAAYWYRKGADLGDPCAMNNLSLLYETGCGVEQNLEQALFWCRKAAAQGDKSAAERIPEIEKKLEKAEQKPVPIPDSPAPKPKPRWNKLGLLFLLIVFILVLFLQLSELFGGDSKRTRSDLAPYNLEDSIEDMLLAGTEEIYTYPDGTWMEFYYDDAGQEIYRVYVNQENDIENLFEARCDDSGRLVYHQIFDGEGNLLRADSYDFHSNEDTAQRRITLGDGRNFQGQSTFDENGYETFTLKHQDGTSTVYVYKDGGLLTNLTDYDTEGVETVTHIGYGYDWENVNKVYGPRQTVIGWTNGNYYINSYVQGLCGGALKEYSVNDAPSEEDQAAFMDIYDPMGNLLEMRHYEDAQMQKLWSHEIHSYDQQGNYAGYTYTYYYPDEDGDYILEQYDANKIRLSQEIHRFEGKEETVLSTRYETEVDDQGREILIREYDGATDRLEAIEENEYDAEGNVKKETRTAYYDDGRYNISVRNGDWKTLSSITYYPNGSISETTEYTAEGVKTKWTQYYENGQVESLWEYTAEGTLKKWTDYYESGALKGVVEHSEAGERSKSTDYYENGQVESVYEYNDMGDVIKITSYYEDGEVDISLEYRYEYDADGNMIKETELDAQGTVTGWKTYLYNADGKKKKRTDYDAGGKMTGWSEYSYDEDGYFLDSEYHYAS